MIPGLILTAIGRFRPYLAHIAIGLAIVGGVWWIHHSGYQAAKRDAEARESRERIAAAEHTRAIEKALGEAVVAIDGRLGDKIDAIRVLRQTIVQPMQKEISVETRYRDASCNLTDGVYEAIQHARSASAASGIDGSVTIPVPPAAGPD